MKKIYCIIIYICLLMSCQQNDQLDSFGYDLERLQAIEGLEILQSGSSMIAVSGVYQGRIFTSSVKGKESKSYGWINWELIENGTHAIEMAGLGGESRLWFAPEWGKFSLCFEAGKEQIDANLRRPIDLNKKQFTTIQKSPTSLTSEGNMRLINDQNFAFDIHAERTISILSREAIEKNLSLAIPDQVAYVGFTAETTIKNISASPFTKETGLIAIWELGCQLTSPDNVVILPLSQPTDSLTEYFGVIEDRLKIKDQVAYYQADASAIGKIGILPQHCKNMMGSYSPSQQLLNIVTFSFDNDPIYVNSVPKNTTPYQGDVINIFNGVVNEKLNLPFYEFESSSSAKELRSTEKMYHRQTTYHFEGEEEQLDKIAHHLLGVHLKYIPKF